MPGETAQNYWEGVPDGSRQRYVTQLLVDPAELPERDPSTFPTIASCSSTARSQQVPRALVVCYPTSSDNPRSDYALPTGNVVPHMQRGADLPIWSDPGRALGRCSCSRMDWAAARFPNDYIVALTVLASYGYVVVAPFHGDPQFADVKIGSPVGRRVRGVAFPDLRRNAGDPSAGGRPPALDFLLASPQYRDHVDPDRIAGFGASPRRGNPDAAERSDADDDRRPVIQAGHRRYAPEGDRDLRSVFRPAHLPAFGRDQKGLDGFTTPFLGIGGFSDPIAPIEVTAQGVLRLHGSRELLALEGVGHYFDFPSAPDIFTCRSRSSPRTPSMIASRAPGSRAW